MKQIDITQIKAQASLINAELAAVNLAIRQCETERRAKVINQIHELMTTHRIPVDALRPVRVTTDAGAAIVRQIRRKAPIKFRDPDTGATWTGRGLQPKWVKARLTAGATLDQFRV